MRTIGLLIPLAMVTCAAEAWGQCAGDVGTPHGAANCTTRSTPQSGTASIDPSHSYSLAELIDIVEHNNPRTRIAWEHAKQKADQLGIERSAYYPILAGVATFAEQQILEPFPNPSLPWATSLSKVRSCSRKSRCSIFSSTPVSAKPAWTPRLPRRWSLERTSYRQIRTWRFRLLVHITSSYCTGAPASRQGHSQYGADHAGCRGSAATQWALYAPRHSERQGRDLTSRLRRGVCRWRRKNFSRRASRCNRRRAFTRSNDRCPKKRSFASIADALNRRAHPSGAGGPPGPAGASRRTS